MSKNQLIVKDEYDKLVQKCLEIIKEKTILFITDLVAYLPISRATFYNYGLDKLDILKDAIEKNRIVAKQGCRAKWYNSDNATLQIALYKLIATDEERNILSNQPFEKQKVDEVESKKPFLEALEQLKNEYHAD